MYIIYSEKLDRYYTGHCEDFSKRLIQHNTGLNLSTKRGIPWELKYQEMFDSRNEALKRELEIKRKKSRKYIEKLIEKSK